jgi:hypothetical protein
MIPMPPFQVFQIIQPLDLASCHIHTGTSINMAQHKLANHQHAEALGTSYWINKRKN